MPCSSAPGAACTPGTPALVMERGLPLFLEKPVCIDEAQYARLLAAPPAQRGRVMGLSRCTSPASYRR